MAPFTIICSICSRSPFIQPRRHRAKEFLAQLLSVFRQFDYQAFLWLSTSPSAGNISVASTGKRMRVLPEFQGKGLGTRMLQILESKAKEFGYTRLILDTTSTQQASLYLYAKCGYAEYKREISNGWETVWMEKFL